MTGVHRSHVARSALTTALLSAVVGLGCGASGNDRAREYFPDMARGPAYKAFAPNAATRTGLTLQAPVAGTIARGRQVFHFGPGEEEAARAGRELTNPLPLSAGTMEDGRGLYQTYCLICHGANGKGDGPLVVAGEDPDAARLHVRPCGAVPARPHLPRRHDGHAEDAVIRGAADARRALEGGHLRQPDAANARSNKRTGRAMTRIWANLLLDGFYAVSLCVSAMFFIATQRATSARWSAGLRRVPEAFMCALPLFLLMLLPLVVFEAPRTAERSACGQDRYDKTVANAAGGFAAQALGARAAVCGGYCRDRAVHCAGGGGAGGGSAGACGVCGV